MSCLPHCLVVVVVMGSLWAPGALAVEGDEGQAGRDAVLALASVPSAARLAIVVSESAHPEVQLLPLREIEIEGMKLAQANAPANAPVDAPLVRVTSFRDETRVFWFSAGASAITSLATRVVLIIPTWIVVLFAVAGNAPLLGPAAGLVMVLGAIAGFTIGDSAAAALVSSLVYDNASRFYTTSFLASFGGHLAGNALAAGVMWLSLGFGGMLLYGLDAISAFTTGAASTAIGIFSTLGAMPIFVVAFLASVALPSVLGTWSMAATARPKEGYVIDPTWKPLASVTQRVLPEDKNHVPMRTLVSVAIPGT